MHLGLYSVHIPATNHISDFKDMSFLKKKIDIFNQETKNNLGATHLNSDNIGRTHNMMIL